MFTQINPIILYNFALECSGIFGRMRMNTSSLLLPVFLIVAGLLWLLKYLNWFPATATIVACILLATGLLLLIWDGVNKQTIVNAPLLMYIGGAIYVRHEYAFDIAPLVAVGMVWSGCLMLLSRSRFVPYPKGKLPQWCVSGCLNANWVQKNLFISMKKIYNGINFSIPTKNDPRGHFFVFMA